MHIPTHILSGWVVGNAVPLNPRERLFCMIAASVADLDGLGIVLGESMYQRWHHVVCHNLPFCVLVSGILVALSRRPALGRILLFSLYVGLFHLHLLMDYYGSGPGWPIVYLWPFSNFRFMNWQAWELSSWQNTLTAGVLLAITAAVAWWRKRTPLEVLMPSLDQKLVGQENVSDAAQRRA
ncbi:MAG TPA: metal-dependent hydrolase [Tepidisphaeraceae bacterium]|jgi:hypothetical protein